MRALLTHVSIRRSGNLARREERIDAEPIRIGRSVSNEIPLEGLAVSLFHASLAKRSDGVYLVARPRAEVLLSKRLIDGDVQLAAGDVIRIGAHELRVKSLAEGDHDIAIEIQAVERRGSDLEELLKRAVLQIERGMWTRRFWSWVAVAAVLGVCVVVPFVTGWQASWTSGPISNGHASIANACRACHEPFEPVRNEACLSCHAQIASHVEEKAEFAYLDSRRCASCHLEHGGADGLAALEDTQCASCHRNLEKRHETRLASAFDFAAGHPEFTLHMVKATHEWVRNGDDAPEIRRETWTTTIEEESGLEFNHLAHVGGVLRVDEAGEGGGDTSRSTLLCSQCHRVDEGGRRMKPIRFEDHCASCHPLNYGDESEEVRRDEAPHGKPDELLTYLRRAYLDDVVRREPGETTEEHEQRKLRFMRPGRQRTPEVEDAFAKADRAFEQLMSDEYCGKCHTLLPEAALPPTAVLQPAITRAWLGTSRFDHSSHDTVRCGSCHPRAAVRDEEYEARSSRFVRAKGTGPEDVPYGLISVAELRAKGFEPSVEASDVLLLGIENCRECHGGSVAGDRKSASTCVMCHPYHQPDQSAIRDRPTAH